MKLSVTILTWNTIRTTLESLAVLKNELIGIDSEIIIVDNGSKDGCEKIATICNKENLGISKGKNQGIEASKGEYILLLDGDIVPVPNSIRMLVDYLERNPSCQAIGFAPNKFTRERNRNGQKNHEEYCHSLDPITEHFGHCIYYGMYRRSVFDVCKMDEGFGPGYGWEDLDFFMQMKHHNIIQWVAGINSPNGKYFHDINSSIRVMGFEEYMRTSMHRAHYFKDKWPEDRHSYVG